jgi:hypothetical protein
MSAIACSAGREPSPIALDAELSGVRWACDMLPKRRVDAWGAGILDRAGVVTAAPEASGQLAATESAPDLLIHRRQPDIAHKFLETPEVDDTTDSDARWTGGTVVLIGHGRTGIRRLVMGSRVREGR